MSTLLKIPTLPAALQGLWQNRGWTTLQQSSPAALPVGASITLGEKGESIVTYPEARDRFSSAAMPNALLWHGGPADTGSHQDRLEDGADTSRVNRARPPFSYQAAPRRSGGRGRDDSTFEAGRDRLKATAQRFEREGMFGAAIQVYFQLIELETQRLDRPRATTLCRLGIACRRAGKHKEAIEAFEWSNRIDEHGRTWCELGITLREQGRLDDSEAALHKSVELTPVTCFSASETK